MPTKGNHGQSSDSLEVLGKKEGWSKKLAQSPDNFFSSVNEPSEEKTRKKGDGK